MSYFSGLGGSRLHPGNTQVEPRHKRRVDKVLIVSLKENSMFDVIAITSIFFLFALSVAYVYGCDGLKGSHS
jgi:hypothetical protein